MKKNPGSSASVPAAPAASAASPGAGYSRLHITPFDSQLLKVVVPSAILPLAKTISFHSLQTFPERPYGFVDLPTADAEKIKKKLNGAVLKGSKIRVEPARPVIMPKPSPDAVMEPSAGSEAKRSKSEKREKKRKRDAQEVVGVELEEGRKVKRGWTVTPEEAAAKKKKEKDEERKLAKSKKKEEKEKKKEKKKKRREAESKFSEGPECLVKITLPPNKVDMADEITGGNKRKSKKDKKRDVVVHEFEKNTKFASFLKTAQPNNAPVGHTDAEFVAGKGWVKEDGTVIEKVKSTRPTEIPKLQVNPKRPAILSAEDEDDTSSSSGSSSSEDESEKPSRSAQKSSKNNRSASPAEDATPSSDSASELDSARPKSASSMRSLTIKIPPATPTPAARSDKVHPLEALYKRQKQDLATPSKPSTEAEPFSFFGGQDFDEDEEMEDAQAAVSSEGDNGEDDKPRPFQDSQPPMTPFTKQDFEWRNTRSAAPTPDTAHPSRMSRIWYQREEDEEGLDNVEEDQDGEEDEKHSMPGQERAASDHDEAEGSTNPNTDFQKWFWEHRGDLNRSWKKRRKTSAKEKRYRENRARADRAI